MPPEQKVIIIPGLGDQVKPLQWAVRNWQRHELTPLVYPVGWHDGELSFKPKLERLVKMIDRFTGQGDTVSLVGTSAGGSAVLNAFVERNETVHRVVNVCGRLRTGSATGFRSFESRTASSPAFADAIKLFERSEKKLSEADRKKIMTVRAMFGDELVPAETTIVQGAYNTTVPTPQHMLSIISAMTIFSKPLIVFLKGQTV